MLPTWTRSASAEMVITDRHEGRVTANPPRKRVAILGFGSSSRHLVPWDDANTEVWTLNQSFHVAERRPDRTFEIHRGESREDPSDPSYFDDLRAMGMPIYMIDHEPEFPTSVRYPLEAVQANVPALYRGYFTCCVAYMIALALHEGFEWIGLYGVDATIGTEYEAQKPCIEAWASLAIGRGVDVYVPPTSALFKTPFLYGYQEPRQWPRVLQASEQFILERIEEHKARCNEALETMHRHEGAIVELESLLAFAISSSRGSVFPVLEGGRAAEKAHADRH